MGSKLFLTTHQPPAVRLGERVRFGVQAGGRCTSSTATATGSAGADDAARRHMATH